MRLYLCAVGRLKPGPEKSLVDDYLSRFEATGRGLGLGFGGVREADERKARTPGAAASELVRLIPGGAAIWALDERGATLSSPGFADLLARNRDQGGPDVAVCIGGADGFTPEFRDRADRLISLGPMVFPHMLVRVMLAEQLYRAATILAGTPYHRA